MIVSDSFNLLRSELENKPDTSNTEIKQSVTEPKNTEKLGIASFVDTSKDPQSYVDRYNNEPKYKKWFDENYQYYDSIEQAVGVKESTMEFVPESTTEQTISDIDSEPTCGTGTESVNGICQVIKNELILDEPKCGQGTHVENGICKLDSQKPKSEGFLDSLIKMFGSWFGSWFG